MKVDILAITAHPDDVELCCSGILLHHIAQGKKVGIVDLTQGELGTRGDGPTRLKEAAEAAKILGVEFRDNLGLADGFFKIDKENQMPIIKAIRKYQPEIVLTNTTNDRHPDHGRAAKLVSEACFLSGLVKVDTGQDKWRPKNVYHVIQDFYHHPDILIDVTPYMDKKMEAVRAFKSQFYDPNSTEPESPISGKEFMDFIYGRAAEMGRRIGVEYAEGLTVAKPIGVNNLFDLS